MGEAKRRGTFDQRRSAAIDKQNEDLKNLQIVVPMNDEERRRLHRMRFLLAAISGIPGVLTK